MVFVRGRRAPRSS